MREYENERVSEWGGGGEVVLAVTRCTRAGSLSVSSAPRN